MADDNPRLIEVAFPLKQASLDSVHEKNVRHGHISTLHIWPARRPLAACRAALIATLLPDPGTETERKSLLERLAGVVKKDNAFKNVGGRKVPIIKEYTQGGILHWGRENGPDLEFFRQEIKKAYGGRAPRVLDPFAGGGAIPLEAMRLGCEVTAIDINPVAWFILKCTLEYPQRLAGQTMPLPSFAAESPEFIKQFLKGDGKGTKAQARRKEEATQGQMLGMPEADLSGHVRAWGHWVLERARNDLERFYPTLDGKPTVAYLWARTVACKNCRATLPLLKTLWLCHKDNKRYRLDIKRRPDRSGVDFDVVAEPVVGGNAAQRRAHDRRVGQGTMSRSGAWCPVCGGPNTVAMTLDDIRAEGMGGRMGTQMTAVVVDGTKGKEYRPPTSEELKAAQEAAAHLDEVFKDIPFGLPTEPLPTKEALGFRVPLYGFDQWYKLFTPRQLVALGTFVKYTRSAREAMRAEGYPPEWVEAVNGYLAMTFDRLADYTSMLAIWLVTLEAIAHTFTRFALPITWDFIEGNPLSGYTGDYSGALEWVAKVTKHATDAAFKAPPPSSLSTSVLSMPGDIKYDLVFTDPPYYDAIPYSDLMDFFYIWLRRILFGLSNEVDKALTEPLGPKWNAEANDGELIDDSSRFGGDADTSKKVYEDGMFRAFQECLRSLNQDGRMAIVFANKNPGAWETLVSSIIRAGFVVEANWPIQTERSTRMRAYESAALSSSVWLVCRKRPETARPGWDNQVLEEMHSRIYDRLRTFWDAGIRGPDFVWAATGPALEAYSKHPVVKKADEPNAVLTVSEFLHAVRRIVVDYVVGRVLSRNGESTDAEALDNPTIYYLLHRHDFGLAEAPVGACILYAQSCSLHDRDLVDRYDLLAYGKSRAAVEEEAEDEDAGESSEEKASTSGSTVRLKRWEQRRRKDLGLSVSSRMAPLIDQIHRIMHLWKDGDVQRVDTYLEEQGLRRNPVFPRVMQALIELARKDNQSDEVSMLESIMNHITARGMHPQMRFMHTDNMWGEEA
jgi:adenine-specific DNA methylase